MFASTKLLAAFSVLAAAAAAVCAAPSSVFNPSGYNTDIVVKPPVTAPVAGDSWLVGSIQTITWETKDIPEEFHDRSGALFLGYIEDGNDSEHLDMARPLAMNFPITDGAVNVTVPNVMPRNDYVVVLFGDSGNASPKFSIIPAETSN
ncbi:hypothetical protein C8Q80DRAFT_1094152 [Daedaleopsis nitida]|nr:hypothetical protein C8Q80DRAFT_1094152 [Daedaleopsis nitida]